MSGSRPRGPRGGRIVGVLLGLGAVVAVGWVPLWWWGATDWRLAFVLLSLTPVAALGALVLTLLAAALRRWGVVVAAGLATVALLAIVVPRAVGDHDLDRVDPPGTPRTVVATANLQFGEADVASVVALVRAQRVTVLSLQEITPEAERRLGDAGLFAELPFRVIDARPGASGTGLASRVPLAPVDVGLRPATFAQVSARADLPGIGPAELLAVHPTAPFQRGETARWVRQLTDIPAPRPDGSTRVVLGDLNATLDHLPLRDVLATGYRDAAAEAGSGLAATWPTDTAPLPRFAAIDHVLLAGRPLAADVVAETVPGTDHAALVVTLAPGP